MKFISTASALNLRSQPSGTVIAELKLGDQIECDATSVDKTWALGTVLTGVSSGRKGYVRRKWLIQFFDQPPTVSADDRAKAAAIIDAKTSEFDAIHYKLGDKAKTWNALKTNGYIDCSGWIYLLAKDIFAAYAIATSPSILYTFSDEQITNAGKLTSSIISGQWLTEALFLPGCMIGLDFAEYSWDRDRPLDIDHIVIVGQDGNGKYISQSSSSGAGVNRVPLPKWLNSTEQLRSSGRMHLVDLLALPRT